MEEKGTADSLSFYLHSGISRFPRRLEQQYKDYYFSKSILIIRISLMLGLVLYSVFGLLDIYLVPQYRASFFIIRFALVSPLLLITFIMSFTNLFKKIMTVMMGLIVLAAGFGIIMMIAIIKVGNTSLYYYAGLILVLMWAYTFTRLSFRTASILCWLVVIGYEIIAVFYQNLLNSPELTLVFINNNFFFISANVLGMFVAYFIELSDRRDFIQREVINQKQELLTAERNSLAEKNEKIRAEMEMARTIQEQLIPKSTPGRHIAAIYKPMEEVGGDFYDFFHFPDSDKIGIFLSDVSGHGVPAALVTSMIKSVLVEARKLLGDPHTLLNHLNEVLVNQTQDYFVTVFYGIYDKSDRSLLFANGGHTDPYICRPDKTEPLELKEHLLPIGTFPNEILEEQNKLYRNYKVQIPEQSKLLFYTDGLIETKKHMDSSGCFEDEIIDVLDKIKDLNPGDFVNSLFNELEEYKGNLDFDDDICIICMDTGYEEEEPEVLEEL